MGYKKPLLKFIFKILGFFMVVTGLIITVYVFLPLISWQVYFTPTLAEQNITTPIPNWELISNSSLSGNYLDAMKWFEGYKLNRVNKTGVDKFLISIPKIKIENALVSTTDTNLSIHLINYPGTSLPGQTGNSVIFGHSTLPQLYNPKDYKTIFTNLYKLTSGDKIIVSIKGVNYKYTVINLAVVDAKDTTVLEQDVKESYLTLITCTPPGTVWKRLAIKAKIDI